MPKFNIDWRWFDRNNSIEFWKLEDESQSYWEANNGEEALEVLKVKKWFQTL
jgi:hypothetical protein